MSVFGGPYIVQSGLVLYYNVRSSQSFTGSGFLNDISAPKPHVDGALSDASINSGTLGIYFASGEYIPISSTSNKLNAVMDTGNSYTFESWFISSGAPWSQFDGYIFGRQGFHCGFTQSKSANGLQIGRYIHWYDNNTVATLTPNTAVTIKLGEWNHLVGCIDQTNGFLKTYFNGQPWASGTLLRGPREYGNAIYFVGGGGSSAGTYYGTNGCVSVARIYNRALDGTEVQQNYNAEYPFYRR